MKAITCDVILSSVRTRVDNSLSLSLTTPELRPDEMLVFLELRQQNLKCLLQPVDGVPAELKDVRGEFDRKSPSTRLRNVLYLLWKQRESDMPFAEWYVNAMEKIIQQHKDQLEPAQR